VAWIRTGIAEDHLRDLYRLYFPRRLYFLSDEPEAEVPALLEDEALRQRARELKRDLASPGSALIERSAAQDPLGAFRRMLERFRAGQGEMRLEDGHFVSRDGRFAIAFLGTRSSAFESRAQAELLDAIDASFREIQERRGGTLVLERSGANRFAVAAERGIRGDLYVIVPATMAGVAVLFTLFFRSVHSLGLALIPGVVGVLAASTAGILVFGDLDGLTIAFGTALIGVAIDYAIHLINHHALAPPDEKGEQTARRLRPSLVLGALTTMASFAGLTLTAFPGFRELGFFAIVGIGVALVVTLTVLPGLLPEGRAVPAFSQAVADRLGRWVMSLAGQRKRLVAIPIAVVLLAALLVPGIAWVDDLSRLSHFDETLVAEDQRVRERVSRFDASRFAIALADSPDLAVAMNDRVHGRLEQAVADGALDGTRSLHAFLWSADLQQRNRSAVLAESDLASRIESVFGEEGFRAGAFRPFREHLAAPAPAPLTVADFEGTSLRELLSPLIFALGERTAVVTYLRGVRSSDGVAEALVGLDDVHLFDQRTFINQIYAEFRQTTLRQIVVGSALVVLVLGVRYRAWRPTLAAFLPSLLVAFTVLSVFSAFGIEMNLLQDDARTCGATMLSLLVSCLTTVFVFGTLALSSNPTLRAIGITTGFGILLSFVFAPVCLVLVSENSKRDSLA
jgi:predicted exporter